MTVAIIVGLSAVALYLGRRLYGARAEVAELLVQNARLKRRIEKGAR
jgi:ketopantoate reductase